MIVELIAPDGTRVVLGDSAEARADPDWAGTLILGEDVS